MTSSEQQERRLMIVSNRGPLEYTLDPHGDLTTRRGSGGLVTALLPAARYAPPERFTWIAVAMADADRMMAEQQQIARKEGTRSRSQGHAASATRQQRHHQQARPDQELAVRYVLVPPEVYERHYERISNRILWFLQHSLWNTAEEPTFTAQTF